MSKYGKKVKNVNVEREKGMLYYVKGNPLEVWKSPMKGRKR